MSGVRPKGATHVTLNNGCVMPMVGLGTWKSETGIARSVVYEAIKVGYRHIDCANIYKNQDEVGMGIAQAIAEGVCKREDLWVTDKVWNAYHVATDIEPHVRDTLAALKLDYLDLLLIHWPVVAGCTDDVLTPSIQETWLAMEPLVDIGLVRTIGVSNFSVKKLRDMRPYARIFPAVNQVELHPMLRQDALIEACEEMGCHVTAYSPLGSSDSASIHGHVGATLLEHPNIKEVAEETGKSTGQVCIRWAVQRGTSVIPKSSKVERLMKNFDVFTWTLSAEQMTQLSSIEPQVRMLSGMLFLGGPYKTIADIWDE